MNDLCKYAMPILAGPCAYSESDRPCESGVSGAKLAESKAKIEREIRRGLKVWPSCNISGLPVELLWLNSGVKHKPLWFCGPCWRRYAADPVGAGQPPEHEPLDPESVERIMRQLYGKYLPSSESVPDPVLHVHGTEQCSPGDYLIRSELPPGVSWVDFNGNIVKSGNKPIDEIMARGIENFVKFQSLPRELLECKASDVVGGSDPRMLMPEFHHTPGPELFTRDGDINSTTGETADSSKLLGILLAAVPAAERMDITKAINEADGHARATLHDPEVNVGKPTFDPQTNSCIEVEILVGAARRDLAFQRSALTYDRDKRCIIDRLARMAVELAEESTPAEGHGANTIIASFIRVGDWKRLFTYDSRLLKDADSRRWIGVEMVDAIEGLDATAREVRR